MARSRFAILFTFLSPVAALLAVACRGAVASQSAPVTAQGDETAITLHLGYFANRTHAPAVLGVTELGPPPVSQ